MYLFGNPSAYPGSLIIAIKCGPFLATWSFCTLEVLLQFNFYRHFDVTPRLSLGIIPLPSIMMVPCRLITSSDNSLVFSHSAH